MSVILYPPIAFLIYVGLVALLMRLGKRLASDVERLQVDDSPAYASGEAEPDETSASGYQGFSQFALFFAVFHLGVLLLATGGFTIMTAVFLAFLAILLVVLAV